jgi:hypothetical protein
MLQSVAPFTANSLLIRSLVAEFGVSLWLSSTRGLSSATCN